MDARSDIPPKALAWLKTKWADKIEEVPAPIQEVLENYSFIPRQDILGHVEDLRTRAFDVFPYPCIGLYRFLNMNLSRLPHYATVLAILRGDSSTPDAVSQPAELLDIGCCLGQDLRKLVYDGVPSSQLVGLDIEDQFIELGFDLFQDANRFEGKFCKADMLSSEADDVILSDKIETEVETRQQFVPLSTLRKRFSVIVTNSVFHLFNYVDQLQLAVRLVKLLRPQPGSLIVGSQAGSSTPAERSVGGIDSKRTRYVHNINSFKHFWQVDVAREVGNGFHFKVDVETEPIGDEPENAEGFDKLRLLFAVFVE